MQNYKKRQYNPDENTDILVIPLFDVTAKRHLGSHIEGTSTVVCALMPAYFGRVTAGCLSYQISMRMEGCQISRHETSLPSIDVNHAIGKIKQKENSAQLKSSAFTGWALNHTTGSTGANFETNIPTARSVVVGDKVQWYPRKSETDSGIDHPYFIGEHAFSAMFKRTASKDTGPKKLTEKSSKVYLSASPIDVRFYLNGTEVLNKLKSLALRIKYPHLVGKIAGEKEITFYE